PDRLLERGLGLGDGGERLLGRGLRGPEARHRLLALPGRERRGGDGREEFAGTDPVAGLETDPRDLAGDRRGDGVAVPDACHPILVDGHGEGSADDARRIDRHRLGEEREDDERADAGGGEGEEEAFPASSGVPPLRAVSGRGRAPRVRAAPDPPGPQERACTPAEPQPSPRERPPPSPSVIREEPSRASHSLAFSASTMSRRSRRRRTTKPETTAAAVTIPVAKTSDAAVRTLGIRKSSEAEAWMMSPIPT